MSKFNKKTLAIALAAAMVMPAAYAYDVQTDADNDPEIVAVQVGDEITMTEQVQVITELGDIIIGRTTGFQILVSFPAGEGTTFGPTPPTMVAGAAAAGWTVNLAAGGGDGDRQAQFTFEPSAPGSVISEGVIATIDGLNMNDTAETDGAIITAGFLARDPVSTATLHNDTANLVERDDGLQFTCTAESPADKIDVGANATYESKTGFVGADDSYEIGAADSDTAALGDITVATTGGYTLDVLAGGDSLYSVVNGNLNGFDDLFLASDDTCATPLASYTINAAETSATLDEEFAALNTAGGTFGANGGTATLCVTVDGVTQIAAQSLDVQVGLNGEISGDTCAVAPIQYNGSVVKVYHVNPAGNTTAQSFVRVINPSTTAGMVTVTGYDDAGNSAGPVTFNLDGRESKQFNSEDLENGAVAKGLTGSFGDGVGKWRLEVTGEFDGMVVQGLNRNASDGTVTNLTDADNSQEQEDEGKLRF